MRRVDLPSLALLTVIAWSTPAWAWLPNGVVWPPERRPVQILLHDSSVDEISSKVPSGRRRNELSKREG